MPFDHELAAIDLNQPVSSWPHLTDLLNRLTTKYADLLDITVDREEDDHLLWEVCVSQIHVDNAITAATGELGLRTSKSAHSLLPHKKMELTAGVSGCNMLLQAEVGLESNLAQCLTGHCFRYLRNLEEMLYKSFHLWTIEELYPHSVR